MTENEEKGLFGWIYANREKILIDYFLKYLFGIGITFVYLGVAVTFYDFTFKWLMDVGGDVEFAWKAVWFFIGAVCIAGGLTLVLYFIGMAYYLKAFHWFRKRMEFIDPTRRLDDENT